ncbi:type II secretion system F family protein [Patescibacteria group bacterium]|nr:type II secretion system F family protein [Patescibacteria group bacterium]MBU4452984.1 type II secretion system F family protein [Patescibacteria group bacterium]MCG2687182.1 type II secretion system F family protein [Candidatus Parcubacteria bacterium]
MNKTTKTVNNSLKTASIAKRKISTWEKLNVRLSSKEKVLFIKYLHVLLKSGLSLDDSLDVLSSQSTGPMKKIVDRLVKEVQSGRTLASGLSYYPHIFSDVFINLIQAGENSGTLEKNLEYLAEQTQKQYDLRQGIKGSMMYPVIVLVGGLGVSIFIIVFIFPSIISLFETLNVDLPLATKVLLFVANTITGRPLEIILGIILFIILFFIATRIRATRYILDILLLKFPVIGIIVRDSILSNVFRLLGTLLQSGMPLKQSIYITESTVNSLPFRKMFDDLDAKVTQGGELVTVLRDYDNIVPMMSTRLIHVGAQTGELENMLLYLGDFYGKEVDETSKRISIIIEPVLIIAVGVMVGFLAFAVISPIYQVITNVA